MLLEQLTFDELSVQPVIPTPPNPVVESPLSQTVRRAERHIVVSSPVLDNLCFMSKNLYNKANYVIRQMFVGTSKEVGIGEREHAIWLRYGEVGKIAKAECWQEYRDLPAKTSQQVLMLLDRNWKSFFEALKVWKEGKDGFTDRPSLPRYKHKTDGRNIVIFTNQQAKLKDGLIRFPKKANLPPLKTKVTSGLQQVRIVPAYSCFVIEVVYKKEITVNDYTDNPFYLGIDLGLGNLAALTSNQSGLRPLLIDGCPPKSINQFFNKKKAEFMSSVGGVGTSERIRKLTLKRNCRIDDHLHKTSRFIIDYTVMHNIGCIVIGQNKGWKQEINIGKRNNQAFAAIPFDKLISQIRYKAEEVGITVITTEESYTSKCSFFDNEEIGKHESYKGKRIKRGLFRTADGKLVNADVNGSGNIIRKKVPDAFADGTENLMLSPAKVTFS